MTGITGDFEEALAASAFAGQALVGQSLPLGEGRGRARALLALRRRADDHQDALRLVLDPPIA
jgi:hypothetical protein